jgi:hypothetical protein
LMSAVYVWTQVVLFWINIGNGIYNTFPSSPDPFYNFSGLSIKEWIESSINPPMKVKQWRSSALIIVDWKTFTSLSTLNDINGYFLSSLKTKSLDCTRKHMFIGETSSSWTQFYGSKPPLLVKWCDHESVFHKWVQCQPSHRTGWSVFHKKGRLWSIKLV